MNDASSTVGMRVSIGICEGCLVLQERGRPGYETDLDRIRTRADLIEWVVRLVGKPWIDAQTIGRFIAIVCECRRWEIDG